MRPLLILLSCLSIALGLRASSNRLAKKLGAFVFIGGMGFLGYTLSKHWVGALIGTLIWFIIPLIFIMIKRNKERYPLAPCLVRSTPPIDETFFPHASQYRDQFEDLGFEPIEQESWLWLEAQHHHRFFWHPEYHTVASICLCERENIAFAFVIFYSELADGTTVKTTNYPFTCPLVHPPKSHWKHVPCEEKNILSILNIHQQVIGKYNTNPCTLLIPNPDTVAKVWMQELKKQAQHNIEKGYIKKEDSHFRYTALGYLYLWGQAIRDLIRLC